MQLKSWLAGGTAYIACVMVFGILSACSAVGGSSGTQSCTYDKRISSASGCTADTAWETVCFDIPELVDGLSNADYCANQANDGIECGGGCCLTFEFTTPQVVDGC